MYGALLLLSLLFGSYAGATSCDEEVIGTYVAKEFPELPRLAAQCGIDTVFRLHTLPDDRRMVVIQDITAGIGERYVRKYEELFANDPIGAENCLKKGIKWLSLGELLYSEDAYNALLSIGYSELYWKQSPDVLGPLRAVMQERLPKRQGYESSKKTCRAFSERWSSDVEHDWNWDPVRRLVGLPVEPSAKERIQTLLDSIGATEIRGDGETKSPGEERTSLLAKKTR